VVLALARGMRQCKRGLRAGASGPWTADSRAYGGPRTANHGGGTTDFGPRTMDYGERSSDFGRDDDKPLARAVTDYATFAWLCDVFVDEGHRGRGEGKLLVKTAPEHPELCGLRLILLATRDADALYETYGGFRVVKTPERWTVRRDECAEPPCASWVWSSTAGVTGLTASSRRERPHNGLDRETSRPTRGSRFYLTAGTPRPAQSKGAKLLARSTETRPGASPTFLGSSSRDHPLFVDSSAGARGAMDGKH
jgi:GNAT superfamily N-acetyltransferase